MKLVEGSNILVEQSGDASVPLGLQPWLPLLPDGYTHGFHLLGFLSIFDYLCVFRSRVVRGSTLSAVYGRNTFVVSWPHSVFQAFPHQVQNMTVFGRLISAEAIVNVDISLEVDAEVHASLSVLLPILCFLRGLM